MDRLRLEILTRILKKIFNQNFFRVFRVFRGLLSSEFRRNLYGNKIFKKILTENALEFLAFGEGFILDRIGDARNLNENLENNL